MLILIALRAFWIPLSLKAHGPKCVCSPLTCRGAKLGVRKGENSSPVSRELQAMVWESFVGAQWEVFPGMTLCEQQFSSISSGKT